MPETYASRSLRDVADELDGMAAGYEHDAEVSGDLIGEYGAYAAVKQDALQELSEWLRGKARELRSDAARAKVGNGA